MSACDPNTGAATRGPPSPHAAAEAHRAFVVEAAGRAVRYAEHAASYAEMGDDAGLARSVRLLATCAMHAAEALPALTEAARQEASIRASAKAPRG